MKRSEMLLKIEKWLDKTYPDHYLYNDSSAKEFLDIIEGVGMLPPAIQEWKRVDGTFLGEGFKLAVKVNKWESEE